MTDHEYRKLLKTALSTLFVDSAVKTEVQKHLQSFEYCIALVDAALQNGLQDFSYPTVRAGTVHDFRGQAYVIMDDVKYHVAGLSPEGDAHQIWRRGCVVITSANPA